MAKEVKCWECSRGDSCFEFHRTKKEAQDCTPIEPYTAYACERCGKVHSHADLADLCCDLGAMERHVDDLARLVTREKDPKVRRLYALALQNAEYHVERLKQKGS